MSAIIFGSGQAKPNLPPEGYHLTPRVRVADIQREVCRHYKLNPIEMVSDRRGWEVSHPRQVAMYLARELTPFSLPNIGRMFGNRDHTTVMHACKAVAERIETKPETAAVVAELRTMLQPVDNGSSATGDCLSEAA